MSGGGSSDYPDVPTGYDESAYFTISSLSDAHTFSERFNRGNGYSDSTTNTTLALGNRININDGTYNTQWMIAGFDVEYNRTASDGITYNNGYGIALIPVTYVTTAAWNSSSTNMNDSSGTSVFTYGNNYKASTLNTSLIPEICSALELVIGDHLITRNVLLSNGLSSPRYFGTWTNTFSKASFQTRHGCYSTSYAWTTSKSTLLSYMQITGSDCSSIITTNYTYKSENGSSSNYQSGTRYYADTPSYDGNKYDQGEANYRLPLFLNANYYSGSKYWLRTLITGKVTDVNSTNTTKSVNQFVSVCEASSNNFAEEHCVNSLGVRPMIYFR